MPTSHCPTNLPTHAHVLQRSLDIVSKNVMGLVISALVLNDGYDKSCIHPPSAPPASA